MKKFDYLIAGAGLYGSVLARQLTDNGNKVLVIDKRNHIGGNCASKNKCGIDVHLYGPHVFHTNNKSIWEYITWFGEFRQFTHKVMAQSNDRVYNFPINLKTIEEIHYDINGFYENLIENDNPANLEEYAISKIGKTLYKMFVKEYTEKQWNCKCTELPISIIKRIPIRHNYNLLALFFSN